MFCLNWPYLRLKWRGEDRGSGTGAEVGLKTNKSYLIFLQIFRSTFSRILMSGSVKICDKKLLSQNAPCSFQKINWINFWDGSNECRHLIFICVVNVVLYDLLLEFYSVYVVCKDFFCDTTLEIKKRCDWCPTSCDGRHQFDQWSFVLISVIVSWYCWTLHSTCCLLLSCRAAGCRLRSAEGQCWHR